MAIAVRDGDPSSVKALDIALRSISIFHNWIRGYGFGDPSRNGEYRFARSYIREGMVVFDVGANVGDYAHFVLSSASGVEVHCFEPVSSTFERLRQRFAYHPQRSSLHLNSYGLSDKPGPATMKIYGTVAGTNSLHERRSAVAAYPAFASFSREAVSLSTLDAYVADKALERIDLLKIDVEGHELKVLQGAAASISSGLIKAVQFEYGRCYLDSGARLEHVFELLSGHGYRLYRLVPYGKIRVQRFEGRLEDYHYSNWVAMKR